MSMLGAADKEKLTALPSASDLASTNASKGAALIGWDGGTTVKAKLDALPAASGIAKKEITLLAAAVAALGAQLTGAIDVGSALPAGARLMGAEISVTTKFQNAGDTGTMTADLGTTTSGHEDWGVDGADMRTTGKKSGGTNAKSAGQSIAAEQASIALTSSVNLSTITAGSALVTLLYCVP